MVILAIFANFIVIRRARHYLIEVNFYSKLSAAYDIGGKNGLERELAKIKAKAAGKQEAFLTTEFEQKLPNIKDPEAFIDQALDRDKKAIRFLQNLRTYAFILILTILILRIWLDFKLRRRKV